MSDRLIFMLAGAGWLLLVMGLAQGFDRWRSRRARDRAVQRTRAAAAAVPQVPANRQQRRAVERRARRLKQQAGQ
jgi:hypothetical protein